MGKDIDRLEGRGAMKNDLISRRAAIRWAKTECNPYGKPTLDYESGKKVIEHLEAMPSAQPDLDSAYTEGYTAAESKYRKMWDEMQANIKEKAFGKRKGLVHTADIDAMPTIQPERKTGKWERHYSRPNVYADLCWHCSNCGYSTPDNWANKWKFCPNCGARMVQEGEDNDS
jgi:rubrerythrin